MAKTTVTDAMAARLVANFSSAPILGLNADMTHPDDGSSWVRLEFPFAENVRTTLGSTYRERGTARIVVATAIASGLSTSMSLCEEIAAIFRGHISGGLECEAPTIREGIDDGSYFIASVMIPYRFEYAD